MNKRYTSIFASVVLLQVSVLSALHGQQNNSLYFFDRIPQSNQLNPAHQPGCALYLGAPALSGIEINGGNNALGFGDIFIFNESINQLVYPLYSPEITKTTIDKLKDLNSVYADVQVDIASFGFKLGNSYISFLMSEKMNMNASIPKDLVQFAYDGIEVGKSYDFSNFGISAMYYREYSIGYSQQINEKMSFGLRGKLLFGKMNLSSRQTDLTISEPTWESIDIASAIRLNMSAPHLKVYTDGLGEPDSIKFEKFKHNSDIINDLVLLNKNKGFAFDIGFQFNATDKVSISASLLDLGFINWKANTTNLSGSGEYSFKGIKIDPNDSIDIGEALIDTLKQVYDLTASSDPYSTLLSPKLYVGVSFMPSRFIKLSALSRTEYIFKTIRQQFTGSVTLYPSQVIGTTLSYTIADRSYDNLGVGIVLRSGPFQMYLMSERIPIFYNKQKDSKFGFIPVYAKNGNFRLGFNLVFGANPKRKLLKDKAFLE